MKSFYKGALLGLAGLVASVSMAAAFYVGYNPLTGLSGVQGLTVATGPTPTVAPVACGTLGTIAGGASVFQVATAGVTSCSFTVTYVAPAGFAQNASQSAASPNGVFCVATDETGAGVFKQSSHSTTSSTLTGTGLTAGDLVLVECNGY